MSRRSGQAGPAHAALVSTTGRIMLMTDEPGKALTLVGGELLIWDIKPGETEQN